ncbi:MAG TPA: 23S rRNA (pseudouridine(1915)-N(3))-methyltransferase RlmH [Steroidobacteraceae bacterium]|nr:23S rRNA (pseudouridine(1915)-N(3))-methyltransferase RlmH [Steroidobacteraceae bacterium]
MLMRIVAAGTRMPDWVDAGFEDYAGRLRGEYRLELIEVPLPKRRGADPARQVAEEGRRMLSACGERSHVVALQVGGRALSTEALARWIDERSRNGDQPVFCIGGPDGLATEVDARARLRWSLSALTLPHGLARVVVAEALYRAVSVIKGLPYHRA